MSEETEVVQNLGELSDEEKAEAWSKWIRNEVNSALDIYLPMAKEGFIRIQYSPNIVEVLESGPVYHPTEMSAVQISLVFEFEKPVDVTKPRVED